jgi:23S rRNA (uracil1939-C5)-methyltransferase
VSSSVEDFAHAWKARKKTTDVIVVDPPRVGLSADALATILTFEAAELVYVSCNPATLARDLGVVLAQGKYRLTDVCPVDMFPHTHHVEVVVRLERVG